MRPARVLPSVGTDQAPHHGPVLLPGIIVSAMASLTRSSLGALADCEQIGRLPADRSYSSRTMTNNPSLESGRRRYTITAQGAEAVAAWPGPGPSPSNWRRCCAFCWPGFARASSSWTYSWRRALGVRRSSVSVAAEALPRRELIDYHRGRIHIRAGSGLEHAACEDYQAIRDAEDRMLGPSP